MRLSTLAGTGLLLMAAIWTSAAAQDAPVFRPHKGVGVYRPFNWLRPSPVDNSLFLEPWNCFFGTTDFERLKKAGFDTMRIFVEPEVFWKLDAAGQEKARQNVGSLITAVNAAGLKIILSMGTPSDVRTYTRSPDTSEFQTYRTAVSSMAKYLSRFDPTLVAFELFNEPPGPCNWTDRPGWPAFQELLYHDARQAAPHTTLVLTGACAAAAESFQYLPTDADYVKDPNTIFTLHYYDPYNFTMQSEGEARKYLTHAPYPADPARRPEFEAAVRARLASARDLDDTTRPAATARAMQEVNDYFHWGYDAAYIDRKFDLVEAWRKKANITASRFIVGEFGVARQYGASGAPAAAEDDRVRWYGLVRSAAESRGFAWSAWSYFGDMSIFDDDPVRWQTGTRHLNPRLVDALGLSQTANSVTGTGAIGADNPMVCK